MSHKENVKFLVETYEKLAGKPGADKIKQITRDYQTLVNSRLERGWLDSSPEVILHLHDGKSLHVEIVQVGTYTISANWIDKKKDILVYKSAILWAERM